MATTFCGSVALAAVFPGFVAVLAPLRAALASLRAAVAVALDAVAQARLKVEAAVALAAQLALDLDGALTAHLEALASARLAIRLKALADLEVQLQAALAMSASFDVAITDPTAYLSGLISAVASVQLDLAGLIPTVAIGAQLDASLALVVDLKAKIAAFDLVLGLLVEIGAALKLALEAVLAVAAELKAILQQAIDAMVALSAELQAALDLTLAPLDAALALEADLTAGPAEVYRYDGALSGLGASVDASVAAHSAIAGAAGVRLWVVIAPDSAPALQGKLSVLLKTNP